MTLETIKSMMKSGSVKKLMQLITTNRWPMEKMFVGKN